MFLCFLFFNLFESGGYGRTKVGTEKDWRRASKDPLRFPLGLPFFWISCTLIWQGQDNSLSEPAFDRCLGGAVWWWWWPLIFFIIIFEADEHCKPKKKKKDKKKGINRNLLYCYAFFLKAPPTLHNKVWHQLFGFSFFLGKVVLWVFHPNVAFSKPNNGKYENQLLIWKVLSFLCTLNRLHLLCPNYPSNSPSQHPQHYLKLRITLSHLKALAFESFLSSLFTPENSKSLIFHFSLET